jgi:hypothetical protein
VLDRDKKEPGEGPSHHEVVEKWQEMFGNELKQSIRDGTIEDEDLSAAPPLLEEALGKFWRAAFPLKGKVLMTPRGRQSHPKAETLSTALDEFVDLVRAGMPKGSVGARRETEVCGHCTDRLLDGGSFPGLKVCPICNIWLHGVSPARRDPS